MSESKQQESKDCDEAKGGASEAKGSDDVISVKVQNSDKIVLFEGDVDKNISLEQLAAQYLPEAPNDSTYSLFEVKIYSNICIYVSFYNVIILVVCLLKGSVKVPQTMKISDLTDESSILLNASYKVRDSL